MSDYKATLNLPQTAFPMKANLTQREPERLKAWADMGLYDQIRAAGEGKPRFILHDGPPYANGELHVGHAINKILKDIIIKSKTLSGFDAPYVPGWDCHGLPIELNVEKKVGKPGHKVTAAEFRKHCRTYASKQVAAQKADFVRMGVFGDWDHPYLTMDFQFEANIVRTLAKIIDRGHLHRGFKPVHWCLDCGSALAEAEVEYRDKQSSAVDVAFPFVDSVAAASRLGCDSGVDLELAIWTTTPWTLPANRGVALSADLDYVLLAVGNRRVLVAEALAEQCAQRFGAESAEIAGRARGAALEGLMLSPPFSDVPVPIVLGEHVTTEAGTGCVHTAPAHGIEDFDMGRRYGLEVYNPVGSNGVYHQDTPVFGGQHIFKAKDDIITALAERDVLLCHAPFHHSYPHCWRHKSPIIFRATPQWFISMAGNGLLEAAKCAVDTVQWIPDWGRARIDSMLAERPDWCISRQRTWGVPIALFVHKVTGDLHPATQTLMEQVAVRMESQGIDAWFDLEPGELLGDDAEHYEKVTDTLDVWFDSGVTHECVLREGEGLNWPADLYLEGSDQHRGWFQSSLLTSIGTHEEAPYRSVLTHGFTVDSEGRKMSKSLGNILPAAKAMQDLGADVLRLYVSAADYRNEISASDEIFKRTADAYRRIRNTARFLLSNLAGFDPAADCLPYEQLLPLDRWILGQAHTLQSEVETAYGEYQFHHVYHKVHNFCSGELGGFYLDIIKDRQYTTGTDSHPRRSAQTSLFHLAEALCRWIAPILSFTAEEIWENLPGARVKSVFLTQWYEVLPSEEREGELEHAFWMEMMSVRQQVNKALELARERGALRGSLDAAVTLYAEPALAERLRSLGEELRFVLITSDAQVAAYEQAPADAFEADSMMLRVVAAPAAEEKCERCWHRRPDVGQHDSHPSLCGRCVTNIDGDGEVRHFA
ncbi:MAG: isoleucine--tRNA ligase [Luminiphilus sp.]|jgi:isoleucyl-tRNA synthetase|nr:isoleucine--tRNA ligase [Luminiphilus sp.]